MMAAKLCCISELLPRDHSWPLTRAIMVKAWGSGTSSAVTNQGPKALPVSKSLPLDGPSPVCISMYWASRAEKSLNTM